MVKFLSTRMNLFVEVPILWLKCSVEVSFGVLSACVCVVGIKCMLCIIIVLTELGNLLKNKYGMTMPREIHFQWDNCGENKVYYN